MDQQVLPGMPEAPPEPAVPVLSRTIEVSISVLPDGGGTLVEIFQEPDAQRYRRVEFLPHGTEPAEWLRRVEVFFGDRLYDTIEPF